MLELLLVIVLQLFIHHTGGTTGVIHAVYISNVDGTNDATIDLYVTDTSAGSDFYIMKTVDVPADSTLVIEKPINLEAGDVLKMIHSANGDLQALRVCWK